MDLVSTLVGTKSCWGLQFSFFPLLQRNTRLPGLIRRTVDLHIAWSHPTFYPNLMSVSLKRLPNPLASPCIHISNCNLILVVIRGFSHKQSFLRNKTKQKDTSNMFVILFLAGKGLVKCFLWHSWNSRETHQKEERPRGPRPDTINFSHWGFQVKEADCSKCLLAELPTYLEIH